MDTLIHHFRQFFNQPRQCSLLIDKDWTILDAVDNIDVIDVAEPAGEPVQSEQLWAGRSFPNRISQLLGVDWNSDAPATREVHWHSRTGHLYKASIKQLNEVDNFALLIVEDLPQSSLLESVLRGREKEYLKLMDEGSIGMLLLDNDLNLIEWNATAGEFLGYSKEEVPPLTLEQITHPGDWEKQVPLLDQLHQGKIDAFDNEKRFLDKLGREKWAKVTATPVQVYGGSPSFLVSIIDIDDYKHTLGKLEESKEMYEALFNQAPVGIVVHQQGKVKFANEETLRMIHCRSFEDLKGRDIDDFIHPDDKPAVNERIQQMIEKNKVVKLEEERLIRMDGKVIVAVGNAARVKYYGEPAVQAIFNDITERKEIEKRLWREMEKSEQYLNVASAMIVVLNPDGDIERINEKGENVLGYAQDELLGKNWFKIITPQDLAQRYKQKFMSVLEMAERPDYTEGYVVTKDGRRRLIGWHSSVVSSDENDSRQLIISGQDITDQKRIEQERLELIKKQEQHNKELQEFTYVVSHNLKSPVSSIMGLVDYIKSLENGDEELRITVEKLYGTSSELDIVIEDLNEILEARKGGSDPKNTIYLEDVAESVLKVLGPEIEQYNATVNLELEEDASVYGIKSYLTNILFNLVQNALKYAKEDIPPVVNISSFQRNAQVVLKVEDNGQGLNVKEDTGRIFELYQRFHANRTGKGMGLYLVKSQVEAMGGKITYESEVGKGTTFYVSFPVDQQAN